MVSPPGIAKILGAGMDDAAMKAIGEQMTPGTSALLVVVRKPLPETLFGVIRPYGGKLLRTSLDGAEASALRAGLEGVATEG